MFSKNASERRTEILVISCINRRKKDTDTFETVDKGDKTKNYCEGESLI